MHSFFYVRNITLRVPPTYPITFFIRLYYNYTRYRRTNKKFGFVFERLVVRRLIFFDEIYNDFQPSVHLL